MKHRVLMFAFLLLWGAYSQSIFDVFGSQGRIANAIAWCESSQNQYAANWTYPDASIGLFQINLYAHAWRVPGANWNEKTAWLQNGYNNISLAHQLYLESGFGIWSCYSRGGMWKYY